jgi:hypothetical protein
MKIKMRTKDKKKQGGALFAHCCGEILVSEHRHDFQPCTCGKVFIDGGPEYSRIGGDHQYWTLICSPEDYCPE